MAGSVNKVILVGNLGKDPEIRVLESGAKLARFSMATSETYTDKTTGERRNITDWHNIVLWRGLADIADKYLRKGQLVYIEGKLKTRSWKDEVGVVKYNTEIIGDTMTMLSSKTSNEAEQKPQKFPADDAYKEPDPLSDELMDEEDDVLPF